MSTQTKIEWTNKTWNPTKGCSKISPGCQNCYAIRMAARLEAMGNPIYKGLTHKSKGKLQWSGKIGFDKKSLKGPLLWKKPQLIFVNSMSDLFHENIPDDYILKVWNVMQKANWHKFQVLTKRAERMHDLLYKSDFHLLPNVWLGVSVESQEYVDRIDVLRETPASVRFISFEPLLDAIPQLDLTDIDWAIIGGESGPRARPIMEEWVDDIEHACREAGTAFFFKQWGGVNKKKNGRIWKGKIWDEYPIVA